MKHKILYRQNNTGKIQQWRVVTVDNVVHTEFGQVDGKLQVTSDVIKEGKNIGKVNETTPEAQALIKAQQLYDKKIKEGYTPDIELAGTTKNVLAGVKPMLAFPIEKKEKLVVFPGLIQPKLDGMRCIAVVEEFKCTLYTRSQKLITTLPHLIAEIETACVNENISSIILDGELYNHEHKNDFNRIVSLIKRNDPHPDCKEIQYHVYDVVSDDIYRSRTIPLEVFSSICEHIRLVPTRIVENSFQIGEFHSNFLADGYEGAIYRNAEMPYEYKRSAGLLKVKVMDDAEFEIVGVNEGNGKLQGHAGAFVCQTKTGDIFKAKLKGKTEDLIEYFVNFDKYSGKLLTVQYQGLTPDGIPRFPVGLRIRLEE